MCQVLSDLDYLNLAVMLAFTSDVSYCGHCICLVNISATASCSFTLWSVLFSHFNLFEFVRCQEIYIWILQIFLVPALGTTHCQLYSYNYTAHFFSFNPILIITYSITLLPFFSIRKQCSFGGDGQGWAYIGKPLRPPKKCLLKFLLFHFWTTCVGPSHPLPTYGWMCPKHGTEKFTSEFCIVVRQNCLYFEKTGKIASIFNFLSFNFLFGMIDWLVY